MQAEVNLKSDTLEEGVCDTVVLYSLEFSSEIWKISGPSSNMLSFQDSKLKMILKQSNN